MDSGDPFADEDMDELEENEVVVNDDLEIEHTFILFFNH